MFANCCPSCSKSYNPQLPHWRWLSEKRRALGGLPRLRWNFRRGFFKVWNHWTHIFYRWMNFSDRIKIFQKMRCTPSIGRAMLKSESLCFIYQSSWTNWLLPNVMEARTHCIILPKAKAGFFGLLTVAWTWAFCTCHQSTCWSFKVGKSFESVDTAWSLLAQREAKREKKQYVHIPYQL